MKRLIGFILGVAGFALTYFLPVGTNTKFGIGITVLAAVFWVAEVFPLYVTAMLVPVLASVLGLLSPTDALSPFFSPVIALFLGGFLLARAVGKYGLDRRFANHVLGAMGERSEYIILGLMITTAALSAFMNNTAAAVLMIPVGISIVRSLGQKGKPFSAAVILGIAFSASIGGLMTLVGSPPNAIAAESAGISFYQWSLATVPFGVILLFILWFAVIRLNPHNIERRQVAHCLRSLEDLGRMGSKEAYTILTMAVVFLLWLTESAHGINYGIVGLLGATMLYMFRLLDTSDLREINWDILLLMGGGLSLGSVLVESGGADYMASLLIGGIGGSTALLYLSVALFVIVLTTFTSNTAAAVLTVPILARVAGEFGAPVMLIGGVAASLAFVLPVSTPPNALAYGSGEVSMRQMMRSGIVMSLISACLLVMFAAAYWGALF
ncbi:MAG: DASS family sodium-coupled anion symporter [archaeon]